MDHERIIWNLHANLSVFEGLLKHKNQEEILYRPSPGKWNLLEIASHLADEESEDFRNRLAHILNTPHDSFHPIDPEGWVNSRNYESNNYEATVARFLEERKASLLFLRELKNPSWKNEHNHPKLGKITADRILANWEAHDYLHMRQIISLNYSMLKNTSGQDLSYAGNW